MFGMLVVVKGCGFVTAMLNKSFAPKYRLQENETGPKSFHYIENEVFL